MVGVMKKRSTELAPTVLDANGNAVVVWSQADGTYFNIAGAVLRSPARPRKPSKKSSWPWKLVAQIARVVLSGGVDECGFR